MRRRAVISGGIAVFLRRQIERFEDGEFRLDLFAFYRLVFPVLAPEAKTFLDANHYWALAAALQNVATGETPRLLRSRRDWLRWRWPTTWPGSSER
jgi:hypothetical protein